MFDWLETTSYTKNRGVVVGKKRWVCDAREVGASWVYRGTFNPALVAKKNRKPRVKKK